MKVDNLCLGCMTPLEKTGRPCPNCGWLKTMHNDLHQLEVGYLLSNENQTAQYIIGKSLGQGGFGITYLAWDVKNNEKVVVKEYFPLDIAGRESGTNNVKPHKADYSSMFKDGLSDMLKEAYKLLAFSNDPNFVTVKNFFQANNTAYIVMEYVDGQTLKQVLSDCGGRLPLAFVLKKLEPIAFVLERMHTAKRDAHGRIVRESLIHRDVSPDNIIFTRDGTAKLLDFGSAQPFRIPDTSLLPASKQGYSPPEQILSGTPQGTWTDVYSLAATIYRAITGEIPPISVIRMSQDSLILPSTLGVEIEPFQEAALLKALSTDYHKRYQTVAEFMAALRQGDSSEADNDRKFICAISLSTVALLISSAMLVFFVYALNYEFELAEMDSDDWAEIITDVKFMIPFIAATISTICLAAYVRELIRLRGKLQPVWLQDESRQDAAFIAQVVCAVVFVLITLIYAETWEIDFFRFDILLYEYSWDYNSLSVIRIVVWIYALCSVAGVWLARQLLSGKR